MSSRLLIEYGFQEIIGVDPSRALLEAAKSSLGGKFYAVVGVAEFLPLRDGSVAGLITCFSLRDVRELRRSVSEFARVVERNGRLEIVDIGRPDAPFFRQLMGLYINWIMPMVARFSIGRRSKSNPFSMIIPTFKRLPTNREMTKLVEAGFGSSELHEFMFGGLIVLDAKK